MKEDIIKCSECNSRELSVDTNSGETYCEECGLVLEENIFEETSAGREKIVTLKVIEHIILIE